MTDEGLNLLTLSESELDRLIGDALYADDFVAKAPTDTDKRLRAERWFASRSGEFRQVICGQRIVKRYVQNKDSVERELFDFLVATLATVPGIPVPMGVLAAKIVRFGVTNLCTGLYGDKAESEVAS